MKAFRLARLIFDMAMIVLIIWLAWALRQSWRNERFLDATLNHYTTETK